MNCTIDKENMIVTQVYSLICMVIIGMMVLFFVLATSVHAEQAVNIMLKDAITIHDEGIYFQDIVAHELVSDSAAHRIQEMLAVRLCNAPQPGRTRQLSRAFIVMKLKNQNIDITHLTFNGSKAVDVTRASTLFTPDDIQEQMQQFLLRRYSIQPQESKVILENIREDIILPYRDYSVRIEETQSRLKSGKLSVRFLFEHEGKIYRKKIVSITVLKKRTIVVATQTINAHADIGSDAVRLEERYVAYGSSLCASRDDVVDKITKMKIDAGNEIQKEYLKEKPIIQKGDMVKAIFCNKNMNICMKLKALEEGVQGDVIKLYSQATKQHFFGTISSHDQVEVMF